MSKCPKCEKAIMSLRVNGMDGTVAFASTWKCITLCCPFCQTVLGAQIDPIAVKTDIINELMGRLRG